MPFGTGTEVTNLGLAAIADRLRNTPTKQGPRYSAIGVGATVAARTAAAGDTALSSQQETRVAGAETVVTTTVTGDTYQNVASFTLTGARAIDEAGLFDAATLGSMITSATFPVVNLGSGDVFEPTWQIQFS